MAFTGEYVCSTCGKHEKKELLTVKKVTFQEMGTRPQVFKSRVVGWLCPSCTASDEVWNLGPYQSPGMVPVEHQGRPNG